MELDYRKGYQLSTSGMKQYYIHLIEV